jgi:hypothetical protein
LDRRIETPSIPHQLQARGMTAMPMWKAKGFVVQYKGGAQYPN